MRQLLPSVIEARPCSGRSLLGVGLAGRAPSRWSWSGARDYQQMVSLKFLLTFRWKQKALKVLIVILQVEALSLERLASC